MGPILLATVWSIHPFSLVRVDDPGHPDALARSDDGAVLAAPPAAGVPWRWESVPHPDGWTGTEARDALGGDAWHARGVTGAGVRVAVFDVQWFGAELADRGLGAARTWDCFASPTCAVPIDTLGPRFAFEQGVHGVACAQVIRDLAPDVELHLVRVNTLTTLENAVRWAIREGIDVVSMSMSFLTNSFHDGTGPVADLVRELDAAGVLMVVSAGNYARGHWSGPWLDGDADGRLDGDGDNGLWIRLRAGSSRGVYVSWNQFRRCGTTDLDALLLDEDGRIVARAEEPQLPGAEVCSPVERLTGTVDETGWYRLEVHARRGALGDLRVAITTTDGMLQDPRPAGSVADPASSPHVLTVGAVDADGYLTNGVRSYSSRGPTPSGLAKPDIAGPDGLTVPAYGPLGFTGTSAAAPAVAGAIALLLSDDPTLTPRAAARRLELLALGDDPIFSAPDPGWGAGKARLPDAAEVPAGCGRGRLFMSLGLLPLGIVRRRFSGDVASSARGASGGVPPRPR